MPAPVKQPKRERLGDPHLMIGGFQQDILIQWAEDHIGNATHNKSNNGCPFCRVWDNQKVSRVTFNLKALSIAASVFSQISDRVERSPVAGYSFAPRTLKDFRESVDAVFKAAGLDKVEWE